LGHGGDRQRHPITPLEIIDDRAAHKVTIVTGQLPISTGICRSATPPSPMRF
jgi:hypothetical protein